MGIHFRVVGVGCGRDASLRGGTSGPKGCRSLAPISISDCSMEVLREIISASQGPCEAGRAQLIIKRHFFSSSSRDIGQVFTANCLVSLFYHMSGFQTLGDQ